MPTPRLRFAPSPTGQLHVGNARTALFNWLYARGHGGQLILRIEDTDTERSTLASEAAIIDDLRWLGLDFDEGPLTGGPHAPYRQSERAGLYQVTAQRLLDAGRAYYCFCTPDDLNAQRQAALAAGVPPKYSGRCRTLPQEVAAARVASGEAAALRFAVTGSGDVTFQDLVRGQVTFNLDVIGDPVIVRSDGRPAYNFAVVVDDAAMQVTHVVRGEDHISNTPRQILLYEALGLTPPTFAHLALVLGPDHAPLSKRHGATSVAEFRARGFLPEALVNYLALLGWSPGDGVELMDAREMAPRFEIDAVGHSAAVFDEAKLAWMNRHYMKLSAPERLVRESWRYFTRAGFVTVATPEAEAYLTSLLPMIVGSVDRLEEAPDRVAFVFAWDAAAAIALARQEPGAAAAVGAFADAVDGPLDRESFRAAATRARERSGLKGRALFHPIRVALTGADSGPELDLAIPSIDRGASLSRENGVGPVVSCRDRARAVADALRADN
jgi:glutamyl-tRNA synthetase/nondiscriminating glutamyl-tRNA synthetase